MKVLFDLAYKKLKNNKTHTIFTCISIMLSVFLLCSLGMIGQSFQSFRIEQSEFLYGDYLVRYYPQIKDSVLSVLNNYEIDAQVETKKAGYMKNNSTDYIELLSFDHKPEIAIASMIEGDYPSNQNEIIVSRDYIEENKLEIGDTITKDIVNLDDSLIDTSHTFIITGIYRNMLANNEQIKDQMITCNYSDVKDLELGYISLKNITKNEIDVLRKTFHSQNLESVLNEPYIERKYSSKSASSVLIIILLLGIVLLNMLISLFSVSLKKEKQDIARLITIGTSNIQLFTIKLFESFILFILTVPVGMGISCGLMNRFLSYLSTFLNYDIAPFPYRLSVTGIDLILYAFIAFMFIFIANSIPLYMTINQNTLYSIKKHESIEFKYKKKWNINGNIEKLIAKKNRKSSKKSIVFIQCSIIVSVVFLICGNFLIHATVDSIDEKSSALIINVADSSTSDELQDHIELLETIESEFDLRTTKYNYEIQGLDFYLNCDVLSKELQSFMVKKEIDRLIVRLETLPELNLNEIIVPKECVLISKDKSLQTIPFLNKDEELMLNYEKNILINEKWKNISNQFQFNIVDTKGILEIKEDDSFLIANLYCSLDFMKQYLDYININDLSDNELGMKNAGVSASLYFYSENLTYLDDLEKMVTEYVYSNEMNEKISISKYVYEDPARMIRIFTYGISLFLIMVSFINLICILISNVYAKANEFYIYNSIGIESKQIERIIFYENMPMLFYSLIIGTIAGVSSSFALYKTIDFIHLFQIDYMYIGALCIIITILWGLSIYIISKLVLNKIR